MFRSIPALALCLAAALALAQDADPVAKNRAELERVRGRIQALQQAIERNKGRQGELEQSLEDSERRIAGLLGDVRTLRQDVDEQNRRLRATQGEQERAQAQLARQLQALALQVRTAYVIGKQGQTKLLLNQHDAHRLGRVMVYYDYLNRARGERIHAVRAQLEDLRSLAARLQQQADTLAAARQAQEAALAALKDSRQQRAQALAALRRRIADEQARLAMLRETERETEKLIASLRDALADIPLDAGGAEAPFGKLKGRLQWPVRGKLLARFGEAKAGGRLAWNGLWIDAPEGAAIKSVARGRVAYVGWMHRYGLIAIIEHEGGYFSLYGHNQSVARTAGDWVGAGDVIARAGATGGHERPGLYFEVRKGTLSLDPRLWLAK